MPAGGHAPGGAVVANTVTFTFIAGALVVARLWTRKFIVRNAGMDDVLTKPIVLESLHQLLQNMVQYTR